MELNNGSCKSVAVAEQVDKMAMHVISWNGVDGMGIEHVHRLFMSSICGNGPILNMGEV